MAAPATAAGGGATAVRALALRTRPGSPFICNVAIKVHKQDSVQGPALFVSGLPLGWDEAAIGEVFSAFGTVTRVAQHPSQSSALVLFSSESSLKRALSCAAQGSVVDCTPVAAAWQEAREQGPVGLKAWLQQHKALAPGNDVLQKQLDAWMAAHDDDEERRQKAKQQAMAEDGWTVVVRSKGRKRTKDADGVVTQSGGAAVAAVQEMAKKRKVKKFEDFYRFQQKEKRRDELLELRERFEEDKRRLLELRASRNFVKALAT